jgi:antirestriction protein ArdC
MKSKEAMALVDKGINTLTEALEASESDNLKAFLAVAANFHNYSLNNWCLIFSQCPTATRVCGYRTWQKLGRQVIKGGKSIKILAPRKGKSKVEEGSDEKPREFMYFTTVSVFDISQTEGDEMPTVFRVEGDPGEYLDALEDSIRADGIKLNEVEHLNGALGVSRGGKIEILEELEPARKFTTLVHEWAHEILHRDKDRVSLGKTQKETEAEAVSYVVGQAIGVDSLGQAADYVQLWKGDTEVFMKCLGRIQKCAKQIITTIQKYEPVTV